MNSGTGFLAVRGPAFDRNAFVRIYDHDGQPLSVIGRVIKSERHGNGDQFPVWLYDVVTPELKRYTGLPVSRLSTYGGNLH